MFSEFATLRHTTALAWPWILFLLLGQLIFTLPEIMLLTMMAIGIRFFRQEALLFKEDPSQRARFFLLSICFASIFLLKLVSSIWALHVSSAISNAFNHIHFLMWPFLFIYFRRVRIDFKDAVLPLAICMCIASVWGAYSYWFQGNTCFSAGVHNCGLLIQTLGTSIIFLTWILLSDFATRQTKSYALLGLATALFTLWITQRRTEWIVLLITFPILLLSYKSWLRKNSRAVSVGALSTLILGLIVLSTHPRFKEIRPEVSSFLSGSQTTQELISTSSVGIRLEQYRMAVSAIADHPWLGWGAGVKPRHLMAYAKDDTAIIPYSHFHNQFLQALLETGLMGFSLALLAVAYIIYTLVIKPFSSPLRPYAVLLGAIIFYHAMRGMANHSFGYSPINTFFVVWTAAIASFIFPIKSSERPTTSGSSVLVPNPRLD